MKFSELILRGVRFVKSWDPVNERHVEVERPTYLRDFARCRGCGRFAGYRDSGE